MRRTLPRALWAVAALLAVNVILLLAAPAAALTRGLEDYFFGPGLVRAEVILRDRSGLHDFLIDRGRLRAVGADSVTLLERDGTVVTIAVSPSAEVLLRDRRVPLRRLKRGMLVTTVRDGSAPAHLVHAGRQ